MRYVPLILMLFVACNRGEAAKRTAAPEAPAPAPASPPGGGNAARGPQLAAQYGCHACHVIPGVPGAQGMLGPSLQGLASRPTISMGTVQNTPANLAQFIQDPATLNPQSSMPPSGASDDDARDLAAFLLTLK